MDMIIRDRDGHDHIVDFKTGPVDEHALVQHALRYGYDRQIRIYQQAWQERFKDRRQDSGRGTREWHRTSEWQGTREWNESRECNESRERNENREWQGGRELIPERIWILYTWPDGGRAVSLAQMM